MTYKKKLIEVALPLEDINREAAREKSIRHGHPSTLHLWWARRPLAACRAVLFASLVDDPSECVPELLADAGKRATAEKELKTRKKAWAALKAIFDKASGAGMKSVADPGPQPKIEDVIEEQERERLFNIIRELVKWENSNDERVLKMAREEILKSTNGKPPPVYDPFCGGGSIPLEAQRLGLEAHASDLNPVPVLINKALIEIPPKFAGKPPVNPEARKKFTSSGSWKAAAGLAEDIRYYGQWMRDEAEKRIGHLYPKVKVVLENGVYRRATKEEIQRAGGNGRNACKVDELTVIAWLWARTMKCPNPACQARTPLLRSFWLSQKKDRPTYLHPNVNSAEKTLVFEIHSGGEPMKHTSDRTSARCLYCGTIVKKSQLRDVAMEHGVGVLPTALACDGNGSRIYLPVISTDVPEVKKPELPFLESLLTNDRRWFSPPLYGLTRFADLFTARQTVALTTFGDLTKEVRKRVQADAEWVYQKNVEKGQYADAVATYLAFAVDRSSDFWCSLCTWAPQPKNELVAHVFGRQALPMVWDFAEANPFSESTGNFLKNLDYVIKALTALPSAQFEAHVDQLDARTFKHESPLLICTDPPYYDNIGYADLSDFFYVWMRRALEEIYPKLFTTVLTPKASELIASAVRHGGDWRKAESFFEEGLREAFSRMREHQSAAYPLTVFYAFRQAETDIETDAETGSTQEQVASTGWETMLAGLMEAGFAIDGTWPFRTERDQGLKTGTNALASSIVLVCRPRPKNAGVASRRDFLAAMKKELPEALRDMQKGNIAPVDLAQAAIGPGMAVFSRYAKVLEADGSPMSVRTALALINQSLDEVLAEQEGEFDADTRWALAWFDQNGFNEGAYGVAETLCTAKNTSVSGMVEAGILAAKGGKVRLLKKEELPEDWNPTTDERLTVWEATHHLIRSLDKGETVAATLLKQLGAMAEVARDLSYRLYTVCERRKWAQDAIGYNALVLSWPDLKRLADEQKDLGPAQRELI